MSATQPYQNTTNKTQDGQEDIAEQTVTNVDPSEVDKFNQLAGEWWDKTGAFATLHEINPLRLNWITENVERGGRREEGGVSTPYGRGCTFWGGRRVTRANREMTSTKQRKRIGERGVGG